jgi:hypothetical protein
LCPLLSESITKAAYKIKIIKKEIKNQAKPTNHLILKQLFFLQLALKMSIRAI